jgi:hypothetical protein
MADTGDLKSHVNSQISQENNQIQAALAVSLPSDLCRLIDAWPSLPDALRAGILAMVDAAKQTNTRDSRYSPARKGQKG